MFAGIVREGTATVTSAIPVLLKVQVVPVHPPKPEPVKVKAPVTVLPGEPPMDATPAVTDEIAAFTNASVAMKVELSVVD